MIGYVLLSLLALILIFVLIVVLTPSFGARSRGDILKRNQKSSHFKAGRFNNFKPLKVSTSREGGGFFKILMMYLSEDRPLRIPKKALSNFPIDPLAYQKSYSNNALVTWLGHSTLLIKAENTTFITDPVFSKRASAFAFIGPKKFPYTVEYDLNDLPPIDAVLISHDHYDHLDYQSIVHLKDKVKTFFVPLGVDAHLLRWGVKKEQMVVLDWHDVAEFENLKFILTPSRHFSGRKLVDSMQTLWASWVVQTPGKKLFFSGDTGYFEGFKTIGEQYGPFDLAFMECGAYNENWSQVHMFPEQSVQAAVDLKSKALFPIHNSKFNLSLHPWQEPLNRVLGESQKRQIPLVTSKIGQSFELNSKFPQCFWWKEYGLEIED